MYSVVIKNQQGQELKLTDSRDYAVLDISGLLPMQAAIHTNTIAGVDGAVYNSARLEARNIVITIKTLRNVEENRIRLYRFFNTKNNVTIYYRNHERDVYTEGYVESFNGSIFSVNEKFQISVICPMPYFLSKQGTEIMMSNIEPLFEFPFDIEEPGIEFGRYVNLAKKEVYNQGDVAVGVVMTMLAVHKVVNPTFYLEDTGELFKLNYTMEENEVIEINTERGRKSVISSKNGKVKNIMNTVVRGGSWIQLNPGKNLFVYTAEEGDTYLYSSFSFKAAYGGV